MLPDTQTPTETTHHPRHVVVVGAGITGLVAARALAQQPGAAGRPVRVTLLEAAAQVGGQVAAIPVPGREGDVQVDVGAESVHLGAPHVAALVRELGLADDLVEAAPGASLLKVGRRLVPLPAGVGPTGPTQVGPVLRSGILSRRALVRAGFEPLTCRKRQADESVGAFVGRRFGREVVDTFVDPLLGNLHSGSVDALSLHATAPQLVPMAREGRSLLLRALRGPGRGTRRGRGPAAAGVTPAPESPQLPMFASWPQGLTRLTEALLTDLLTRDASEGDVVVRTSARVEELRRHGRRWQLVVSPTFGGAQPEQLEQGHQGDQGDQEVIEADDVILTTGVPTTTALLAGLCPEAVAALDQVDTATVATVVLGYDRDDVAGVTALQEHNGLLLSSRQAVTVKALTNLSRKWPSRFAGATHHVVRVSVGSAQRSTLDGLDDQQVVERCVAELASLLDVAAPPRFTAVVRWNQAMPQLAPGHLDRVARARAGLADLPGLWVAGGAWDGLGLGNTVASGQRVAAAVLADSSSPSS